MMTRYLIRRFVQDSHNTRDQRVRQQYGNLASTVGLIVNLVLSVSKILAGWFSGSLAIMGDGINNLTDAASSIISLVSFKITSKPADKEHPFGHARAEYLFSSVVAVIILYIGVTLFIESVKKILSPSEIEFSWVMVGILVGSILAKGWLYRFYRQIGRLIQSGLLKATSVDSLSDVLSTSVVLLSLVLTPLIGFNLDGYMGALVAILILKSGYDILRDTVDRILGHEPSSGDIKTISEFIRRYEGVLGIHDLIIHDYGPGNRYVSVHVEVDSRVDVMVSHELIDKIEREAREQLEIGLTIHMDPVVVHDPRIDEIKKDAEAVLAKVYPDLTLHDFRVVDEYQSIRLVFDVLAPYECKMTDDDIVEAISRELAAINPLYAADITIDRGSVEGS